ncbi:hypothetical protein V6N13_102284 [Hibiscus sabdariffa]|uniref:CCHC-type domain-containing protein n=1 Tax=Hibiscus sabdariffa TaxID=183260 RepID=A0ABR2D4B7_9ROSI
MVNGKLQVVEYESLPIICFNCGKYGHVNEACPDKIGEPGHNNPTPPTPDQPHDSVTSAFGPWMVIEKRQRRPAKKPQSNAIDQSEVAAGGSRYNPLYEDSEIRIDDDNVTKHANDPAPSSPHYKQKGKKVVVTKQPKAVHIRKPITVSLNDFPIVSHPASKASSSRSGHLSRQESSLAKSHHSAIVLPETSEPVLRPDRLIQNPPSMRNNSHIMGDPPDSNKQLPSSSIVVMQRQNQPTSVAVDVPQSEAQYAAMID